MASNITPIPAQVMPPAPGTSTKLDSNAICTIIQQMNYCYDQNKTVYCEVEIQNKKNGGPLNQQSSSPTFKHFFKEHIIRF